MRNCTLNGKAVVKKSAERFHDMAFLDSFLFLFQSFTAEKENRAVICLHPVGIARLALYNRRHLALSSPVSDNDVFSCGKGYHKALSCGLFVVHQSFSSITTRHLSTVNQAQLPLVDQDVGDDRRFRWL
jgi:hypothetical protein